MREVELVWDEAYERKESWRVAAQPPLLSHSPSLRKLISWIYWLDSTCLLSYTHTQPTNHLDHASVAWLTNYLQSQMEVTCLIVSHDTLFLDNVVTDIIHYETVRQGEVCCTLLYSALFYSTLPYLLFLLYMTNILTLFVLLSNFHISLIPPLLFIKLLPPIRLLVLLLCSLRISANWFTIMATWRTSWRSTLRLSTTTN